MQRNKRLRKHPPYYLIPAFIKLLGLTNNEIASKLGINTRTFLDKVNGYYDFSFEQSVKLKKMLVIPSVDLDIFLTENVMKQSHFCRNESQTPQNSLEPTKKLHETA